LTIKFTLDITTSAPHRILAARRVHYTPTPARNCNLCCPSIFNCQRTGLRFQKPRLGTLFRVSTPGF
jgi:hypothetical protein